MNNSCSRSIIPARGTTVRDIGEPLRDSDLLVPREGIELGQNQLPRTSLRRGDLAVVAATALDKRVGL
jgi:hypothetical protein